MLTAAIIILSILIIVILLFIAASFYFYNVAIARQPKDFLMGNPDLEGSQTETPFVFDTAWIATQSFEKIEMKSDDGLLLRGYYLAANTPTSKVAILAHGYTSRALPDMAAFARMYHETLGFNVFIPDDRGHGESEGTYIGFGWPDRLDYLKWLYLILQKVGDDAQIVLHGLSMGGATVLMTSGEKLPDQVKCIVADCAYSSVKEILAYQLKRMYKLSAFPLVPLTSAVCKLRAGYSFGEASTLQQVRKNSKPILFIHGAEDVFVPTAMVYPLYEACKEYKELLIVPAAGHGLAYTTDPIGYTQKVKDFVHMFVHESS